MLYQLLELQIPFKASSLPELARRITEEEPPPFSGVRDAQLAQAVRMTLEKEPRVRSTARQLLALPALHVLSLIHI